ncbi:substrate-binding domain-containing protein [Chloroflexi bacterium TSY]|nr:substrate-binding domain-containing protein [Chloroflexi bacterium TSY]
MQSDDRVNHTLSRRQFLRLTGLAATGAALVACTPAAPGASSSESGGGASEAIQLSYTSWGNETRLNSDEENITAFVEQNAGIEVEFIGISSDYASQLLTMIAGGTAPDVMRINAWSTHAFYSKGTAMAIDDRYESAGINPEELFVVPFVQCVYDGKWYGIPRGGTGNQIVYYNKEMFDDAGVPYPEDPKWTWDDFLETAQALTRDTDGDGEVDV